MIADELRRSGVTDACISPGSRSTAMVLGLRRAAGVRTWVVLDERSAGFFALGMARETGRPVVLVCTSGTASANYLPAVVEASLSRIPLVVITADRPPEARDCRSAQTIDQVRLFGSHARWSVDVLVPTAGVEAERYYRTLACRAVATAIQMPAGPVHLNLPMREPLIDVQEEKAALSARTDPVSDAGLPHTLIHPSHVGLGSERLQALAAEIGSIQRGLIVCGPSNEGKAAAPAIALLARRLGWPILADPLSALRLGRHDTSQIADAYDIVLRDGDFAKAYQPEAVIQFGDPPVSKPLAQFLASSARRRRHLLVAEIGTWPDPLWVATDVIRADAVDFSSGLARTLGDPPPPSRWLEFWLKASAIVRARLNAELSRETRMFEGKVLTELVGLLPDGAAFHVGNSMPVRDLDAFVGTAARDIRFYCNRGANGIDGVLSAAMGAAAARTSPTALVVGDVSFLHDIGALAIASRYPLHLLVVVINNDGGGIFSFLPQSALGETFETFFGTAHGLGFGPAVAMHHGRHAAVSSWKDFAKFARSALEERGLHVLEIRSDRGQNFELHRRLLDAALGELHAMLARGSLP
jgi:2-succinyl-5-enolpyruvyl-6-hydroxy-3-cyclohexene-1-carboxylate synthase